MERELRRREKKEKGHVVTLSTVMIIPVKQHSLSRTVDFPKMPRQFPFPFLKSVVSWTRKNP